eukprot:m.91581 g.91581  ORF g.91581 m.91581 type:complete len:268 (+) comp26484_c0_seq3:197-1000(+)
MGNENSSPAAHTFDRDAITASKEDSMPFQYASYSREKDENEARVKDPQNNLIVVNSNKRVNKTDKTLEALEKIPYFYPILRASIGPNNEEQDLGAIDPKHLVCICNRFKTHLQSSAHIIEETQYKLGDRMRWVVKNANARAARFGKVTQSLQKSSSKIIDVTKVIDRVVKINDMIKYVLLPRLDELNLKLPPQHRLEPFKYSFESTELESLGTETIDNMSLTEFPRPDTNNNSPILTEEIAKTPSEADMFRTTSDFAPSPKEPFTDV